MMETPPGNDRSLRSEKMGARGQEFPLLVTRVWRKQSKGSIRMVDLEVPPGINTYIYILHFASWISTGSMGPSNEWEKPQQADPIHRYLIINRGKCSNFTTILSLYPPSRFGPTTPAYIRTSAKKTLRHLVVEAILVDFSNCRGRLGFH